MLNRKLMIDRDTIRAYKRLVGAGIVNPPELTPEILQDCFALEARKPAKRRGSYYIFTSSGLRQLDGWIMTVDGLEVGCNKPGDYSPYNITDIKSGCLIGTAATLKGVPDAVCKVSKLVKSRHADILDKQWRKMVKTIKAAYKAA